MIDHTGEVVASLVFIRVKACASKHQTLGPLTGFRAFQHALSWGSSFPMVLIDCRAFKTVLKEIIMASLAYQSMTIPQLVYLLGNRRLETLPDRIKETTAIEGELIRAIADAVAGRARPFGVLQPDTDSEHSLSQGATVAPGQQFVTIVTPEEKA